MPRAINNLQLGQAAGFWNIFPLLPTLLCILLYVRHSQPMHALTTVALCLCLLQSQPPSPSAGKSGKPEQQKAAPEQQESSTDQHSTPKTPSAVQQPTTQIAIWNERKATDECKKEPSADWWTRIFGGAVALFTFALAILAFLQWRVMGGQREAMEKQWKEMERQVAITRTSANAAQDSAKAALQQAAMQESALRQWVTVKDWKLAAIDDRTHPTDFELIANIVNQTKVPLWVDLFSVDLPVRGEQMQSVNTWLVPDVSYPLSSVFMANESQAARFWDGGLVLTFKYTVWYRDALQNHWKQETTLMLHYSSTEVVIKEERTAILDSSPPPQPGSSDNSNT